MQSVNEWRCDYCGTPRSGDRCRGCGSSAFHRKCGDCGARMTAATARLCPACAERRRAAAFEEARIRAEIAAGIPPATKEPDPLPEPPAQTPADSSGATGCLTLIAMLALLWGGGCAYLEAKDQAAARRQEASRVLAERTRLKAEADSAEAAALAAAARLRAERERPERERLARVAEGRARLKVEYAGRGNPPLYDGQPTLSIRVFNEGRRPLKQVRAVLSFPDSNGREIAQAATYLPLGGGSVGLLPGRDILLRNVSVNLLPRALLEWNGRSADASLVDVEFGILAGQPAPSATKPGAPSTAPSPAAPAAAPARTAQPAPTPLSGRPAPKASARLESCRTVFRGNRGASALEARVRVTNIGACPLGSVTLRVEVTPSRSAPYIVAECFRVTVPGSSPSARGLAPGKEKVVTMYLGLPGESGTGRARLVSIAASPVEEVRP